EPELICASGWCNPKRRRGKTKRVTRPGWEDAWKGIVELGHVGQERNEDRIDAHAVYRDRISETHDTRPHAIDLKRIRHSQEKVALGRLLERNRPRADVDHAAVHTGYRGVATPVILDRRGRGTPRPKCERHVRNRLPVRA